jgi:cytochrome P450
MPPEMIIVATPGSETNATLLDGAIYNLAMHSQVRKKLVAELLTTYKSRNEVNMTTLAILPYSNAVLEERLRSYPPSAFNQAKIVPKEGTVICGLYVPPGIAVGVAT